MDATESRGLDDKLVPMSTAPGSISAGSGLGPYEILSQIGQGGMGQVWKARDTRLDRFFKGREVSGVYSQRCRDAQC